MDSFYSAADPDIGAVWLLVAAVLAVVLTVVVFRHPGFRRFSLSRKICVIVLVEYLFLVLASTVLSRAPKDTYQYELQVFWSYRKIAAGCLICFWENLLNIVLLMPMGFLLPVILKSPHPCRRTILIGFAASFTIEILQLITKRGLFEFDDMIHNTLGVAIGVIGYYGIWRMGGKRRR